ncbi:DUF4405 domain-containing protein [Undibacterium sp.]|jgi:hypothetical protein|uniref:DUF4405 domain-containing protein n=1 Tax=Undibacterium sp. TaxID=1914977 RepID=UPI002CCC652B|nr:DUF4405 domain-containing protein [Undibacterium sp.]HTD03136.1 DUF4405 domain-containing protein [Undibacterium sp.]
MKPSPHHLSHSRSRAVSFRLERWHRWTLYGVGTALLLTGLLWLLAHYFLRVAGEFGETVHPLEHLSMQMHGAVSMIAWFFIGSLLNNHIRRAHNARRNTLTGWLMIALLSWLTVSGYGLYYLVTENNHHLWSLLHWISGILLPALVIWHISAGRRLRMH